MSEGGEWSGILIWELGFKRDSSFATDFRLQNQSQITKVEKI